MKINLLVVLVSALNKVTTGLGHSQVWTQICVRSGQMSLPLHGEPTSPNTTQLTLLPV